MKNTRCHYCKRVLIWPRIVCRSCERGELETAFFEMITEPTHPDYVPEDVLVASTREARGELRLIGGS